jgi:L-amino acid N-acyltransferase YncA
MGYSIRRAEPGDAAAIAGILNPIIEEGTHSALDTVVTVEQERRFIENFPQRGLLLVAVVRPEQEIVGFQSMEPFATYTHAFDHVGVLGTYVKAGCRRQGVARALFTAMFEMARGLGYEKIFTFVRVDNPAALAAYVRAGFSVVGMARKHVKVNGEYVDEVLVEKFL